MALHALRRGARDVTALVKPCRVAPVFVTPFLWRVRTRRRSLLLLRLGVRPSLPARARVCYVTKGCGSKVLDTCIGRSLRCGPLLVLFTAASRVLHFSGTASLSGSSVDFSEIS